MPKKRIARREKNAQETALVQQISHKNAQGTNLHTEETSYTQSKECPRTVTHTGNIMLKKPPTHKEKDTKQTALVQRKRMPKKRTRNKEKCAQEKAHQVQMCLKLLIFETNRNRG